MGEVKKAYVPSYENELCIYEEETLQKIEEFKSARSNWLTNNVNPTVYTNVVEGLDEPNIYKGRCICLRKLRLKTTLLRTHIKSLRPLRYYTLKRMLTDPEEEEFAVESETPKTAREKKTEDLEQICSSGEMWTKDAVDECYRKAEKSQVKKIQQRKKKDCKQIKPRGPCKRAITKLKASTLKDGMIESCKCDEGREVTVVIKGICLCDKNSLNNLDLNKVCDRYSKFESMRPEETPVKQLNQESLQGIDKQAEVNRDNSKILKNQRDNTEALEAKAFPLEEEPIQKQNIRMNQKSLEENRNIKPMEEASLRVVDSLEIYRKRIVSKSGVAIKKPAAVISARALDAVEIHKKGESIGDTKDQAKGDISTSKLSKNITFKNQGNVKADREGKPKIGTASEITLFRKLSSSDSIFAVSDTESEVEETLPRTSEKREKPASEKSLRKNEQKQDKFNPPTSDSMRNLFMNEDSTKPETTVKPLSDNKMQNSKEAEHTKRKSFGENPAVIRWEANLKTAASPGGTNTPGTLTHHISKKSLGRNEKNDINIQESILKSETETGNQQKPDVKRGDSTDSVITLYKNKPEEKSDIGLTKEELEKLKSKLDEAI